MFTSAILPPYVRRSRRLEEALPILYLRGLSTGDFAPALTELFGEAAKGFSPASIVRFKQVWEAEYQTWQKRDLSGAEYVYWWVDGVNFAIRLEEDRRLTCLVIVGVRADGTKDRFYSMSSQIRLELAGRQHLQHTDLFPQVLFVILLFELSELLRLKRQGIRKDGRGEREGGNYIIGAVVRQPLEGVKDLLIRHRRGVLAIVCDEAYAAAVLEIQVAHLGPKYLGSVDPGQHRDFVCR